MTSAVSADLHHQFGEIDIYLFDQLLRGRFDRRRRVLDRLWRWAQSPFEVIYTGVHLC
jgi:hypothetical protein